MGTGGQDFYINQAGRDRRASHGLVVGRGGTRRRSRGLGARSFFRERTRQSSRVRRRHRLVHDRRRCGLGLQHDRRFGRGFRGRSGFYRWSGSGRSSQPGDHEGEGDAEQCPEQFVHGRRGREGSRATLASRSRFVEPVPLADNGRLAIASAEQKAMATCLQCK